MTVWNSNGVVGKQDELREFAARHKPDVLLLVETQLTLGKMFRLPNYVCHRDDRIDQPAGGTAIAVKISIRHRVVLSQRRHLECTAVEFHGALGDLLVVSAYKSPQAELLNADLDVVFGAHRKVVMAGDLNCKQFDWGRRLCNRNGKILRRYTNDLRVTVIGPTQPTYYPVRANARPDVLNVAVVKGICCPVTVSSIAELSSDHCPIGVHVAIQHPIVRDERQVIEYDRIGPAFCRRFPEHVLLDTAQLVDEAAALFDTAVVTAMDLAARIKLRITPHYQRIPDEIGILASKKNRLRRSWQRTRYPADRAAFNRASGKGHADIP